METDQNESSPENSPSDDERRGGASPPKALSGGLEDVVVSSSFNVAPREEATVVIAPPQEASGRKRGRAEEQGGGSSSGGGQKGKKKGELTDPPSSDPKCATCGKTFGSWKAVFGHLRSHPERDYRGAFPPPKIWEEMLRQEAARRRHGQDQGSSTDMGALDPQQLASTMLNVARDVSSKLSVGGDIAAAMSSPSGKGGLGIDLNDPEEPDSPPRKGGFPFDLNKPAPESKEDDDNES